MNIGIQLPVDGEEATPESIQDTYRNAQAMSIIMNSISTEEYNKVRGRQSVKEVWGILRLAHEGDPKAKRGKIEMLEASLAKFTYVKGESLQQLYDRLMVLVNKIRALGSKEWDEQKVS